MWVGTMNHTITPVGATGTGPCEWPILVPGTVRFIVNSDGVGNATYDVDGCGVSEPHAEFTGTSTDEGFTFPQLIVQTNGALIAKVSSTRAQGTFTNLQGSAANGVRWVTEWDVRCVSC